MRPDAAGPQRWGRARELVACRWVGEETRQRLGCGDKGRPLKIAVGERCCRTKCIGPLRHARCNGRRTNRNRNCTAAPCLFLSALQPPHFEGLLLLTSAHQGPSLTWQSHTSLSSNITYNNVILTSRRLTEDDDALEPSGRMFGVLFLFQDDESTSQSRPAIGNTPHRTSKS